jgi:hypothetical protein
MKIWRLCTIELWILDSVDFEVFIIREDSEVFQMLSSSVHIEPYQIYLQSGPGGQALGWLWWSFEIAIGNIDPQSSMIF